MSHLTHTQRQFIENGLMNGKAFREIGRDIGKSHTTVSREVRKHRIDSDKGASGHPANRCALRRDCTRMVVCGDLKCNRKCRNCSKCNEICPRFVEEVCERLEKPPYVCNGCREERRCVLRKKFYIHDKAHGNYRTTLSESRQGAGLSEGERLEISQLLDAGLKRGQSVHHVMASNRDSFTVCEKSVYRYINTGVLGWPKRHHLPMAPRMKPRRKKSVEHKVDTKCRIGRTREDFKKHCEAHPDLPIVEMDSVLGTRGGGGKVLLTMNLNTCSLMLAFLRDANNSQSVIDVFNRMENLLGTHMFKKLFPVILTDNGSEFSNPAALETSPLTGGRRTGIFYCDPCASWQKGHVENNHLNLRKIFPKGRSFADFTQADVDLAMCHVNSLARQSLNDIPAITLFETVYGRGILEKLGMHLVDANTVSLTPELFGK